MAAKEIANRMGGVERAKQALAMLEILREPIVLSDLLSPNGFLPDQHGGEQPTP